MAEEEALELNPNEIVAKVILEAANETAKSLGKPILDKARRAFQAVTNAYSPFLETTFQRVKNIKTFLKPNEPVDLLSVYVPANLSDTRRQYDANMLVDQANNNERVVISGLAGRGKSILMRYVAISMYHTPRGKIPILLELRSMNQLTTKDLLSFIHLQFRGKSRVRFEDFEIALDRGTFALLLDGFDEIEPSSRQIVEEQLLDIALRFSKCAVIVSSRPDVRFQSWQDFKELQVCPLSLKQAKSLVIRADYDPDITKTFLKRLTPDFFRRHESFLSTPLLIIMMMLTFEDYAEIPTSLHAFYKNAFDTLMRRHDATKPRFIRKTHSNCTAEQFRLLFSSFCLLTYSKSKFEFSRDDVLKFLSVALKQQQIVADINAVLTDLIESICLLQQEGFEISFVHRSFQEYFCALFLAGSAAGLVKNFLETGRFRVWDDMLPMLYGMAGNRVEKEWANDTVDDVLNKYESRTNLTKLVIDRYSGLKFYFGEKAAVYILLEDTALSRRFAILQRMYPANFLVHRSKAQAPEDKDQWQKRLRHLLSIMKEEGDARLETFSPEETLRELSFPLRDTSHDSKIMELLRLDKICSEDTQALRDIREEQRVRKKEDDKFLSGVFGDGI